MQDLEGKLTKLQKFADGGAKQDTIQSYPVATKAALAKLLSKLTAKAEE
ncbi:MAG: hypothetical protein NY202_02485 [Mollicutes bacterium UO1]